MIKFLTIILLHTAVLQETNTNNESLNQILERIEFQTLILFGNKDVLPTLTPKIIINKASGAPVSFGTKFNGDSLSVVYLSSVSFLSKLKKYLEDNINSKVVIVFNSRKIKPKKIARDCWRYKIVNVIMLDQSNQIMSYIFAQGEPSIVRVNRSEIFQTNIYKTIERAPIFYYGVVLSDMMKSVPIDLYAKFFEAYTDKFKIDCVTVENPKIYHDVIIGGQVKTNKKLIVFHNLNSLGIIIPKAKSIPMNLYFLKPYTKPIWILFTLGIFVNALVLIAIAKFRRQAMDYSKCFLICL